MTICRSFSVLLRILDADGGRLSGYGRGELGGVEALAERVGVEVLLGDEGGDDVDVAKVFAKYIFGPTSPSLVLLNLFDELVWLSILLPLYIKSI